MEVDHRYRVLDIEVSGFYQHKNKTANNTMQYFNVKIQYTQLFTILLTFTQ